jgi:hypothetical protein
MRTVVDAAGSPRAGRLLETLEFIEGREDRPCLPRGAWLGARGHQPQEADSPSYRGLELEERLHPPHPRGRLDQCRVLAGCQAEAARADGVQ